MFSMKPTLSVGLGVGHFIENMAYLLELGRKAEKLAKRTRASLGIVLDKRSGGQTSWSCPWSEDPAAILERDAERLRGRLSSKKVYEIRRIADRMPSAQTIRDLAAIASAKAKTTTSEAPVAAWSGVLLGEVRRALSRSEGLSGLTLAEAGMTIPPISKPEEEFKIKRRAVIDWTERLKIARALAGEKGDAQ